MRRDATSRATVEVAVKVGGRIASAAGAVAPGAGHPQQAEE